MNRPSNADAKPSARVPTLLTRAVVRIAEVDSVDPLPDGKSLDLRQEAGAATGAPAS
jgi:hypothetical protein